MLGTIKKRQRTFSFFFIKYFVVIASVSTRYSCLTRNAIFGCSSGIKNFQKIGHSPLTKALFIDFLVKTVKLLVAGLRLGKLALVHALLGLYVSVVLVHHDFHELVLEHVREVQDAAQVVLHKLGEGVHADVVGGGAQAVAGALVAAGKILVFGVVVGGPAKAGLGKLCHWHSLQPT